MFKFIENSNGIGRTHDFYVEMLLFMRAKGHGMRTKGRGKRIVRWVTESDGRLLLSLT